MGAAWALPDVQPLQLLVLAAAGLLWLRLFGRPSGPRTRWLYEPGSATHYLAQVLESHSQRRRRPVVVYMDGCFDMFHYGHANALRQARACGDVLVVGVVGDAEILANKGPPVFTESERLTMVESVKWVDKVVPSVPYDVSEAFMRHLFEEHKVDYILHGDDPCLLPDGTDAYAAVKKAGRFKMIKRTEGISTTDLVGRMLMCKMRPVSKSSAPTEMHADFSQQRGAHAADGEPSREAGPSSAADAAASPGSRRGSGEADREAVAGGRGGSATTVSHFCPTSRRIRQFSSGRTPPPGARVVYVDGAFDMFHPGHVEALRAARAYGDFLLCGVHNDEAVSARRGFGHLPILSLHERSLSVLACRFVDEVVIGAPEVITEDFMTTFNIATVVHGTVHEPDAMTSGRGGAGGENGAAGSSGEEEEVEDPYALPKRLGKYVEMKSPKDMTTASIIQRILGNRERYEERQRKKNKSETDYYTKGAKQYVKEM